jgi:hypothetical protein
LSERRPDERVAHARRWLTGAGVNTYPPAIAAVRKSLEPYYDDLAVVDGIVRFRLERGLRSGEVVTLSA